MPASFEPAKRPIHVDRFTYLRRTTSQELELGLACEDGSERTICLSEPQIETYSKFVSSVTSVIPTVPIELLLRRRWLTVRLAMKRVIGLVAGSRVEFPCVPDERSSDV